ncbi:MAG: epimerase [Variovorax sp.]|nr:epimerase [Variovorax sp.]
MNDRQWLRFSLVLVWLATAAASVWELHGQSAALLAHAGVRDPSVSLALIVGGAAVDAVLGLALWFKPSRGVYLVALAVMGAMTVAATLLEPSLWLHPLGPLTKNVPIVAVLWTLARSHSNPGRST